jgi:hypothetical protein
MIDECNRGRLALDGKCTLIVMVAHWTAFIATSSTVDINAFVAAPYSVAGVWVVVVLSLLLGSERLFMMGTVMGSLGLECVSGGRRRVRQDSRAQPQLSHVEILQSSVADRMSEHV